MRGTVTGAGGFIGGHLVRKLVEHGWEVRAVDSKPVSQWHQVAPEAENLQLDVSHLIHAHEACRDATAVFNLAADMGGMGFITGNKLECMLSVLTTTNMLRGARSAGVKRFFYSSSACVYPMHLQRSASVTSLREEDAYPADAEDGYGWEKLFGERLCRHFSEDAGLVTRVARYHNVYGPHGTWDGGREKAPAALCRKVATAVLTGDHTIEIWGDGEQTRSFMYVDDCVQGTIKIMASDCADPLNLGSSELVSMNQLVTLIESFEDIELERIYVDGPQGVRGRNSDNTRLREITGWEPQISLEEGMRQTYLWVKAQVAETMKDEARARHDYAHTR